MPTSPSEPGISWDEASAAHAEPSPDALGLAQALIRCASVTPAEAGALSLLQGRLEELGFRCWRLPFESPGAAPVDNLYARIGQGRPHFCFAGHTDVVPPGDCASWSVDPFGAVIRGGKLYGRGAVDMKTAIACFVAAAHRFLEERGGEWQGSISVLLTGDEEGPAVNGTRRVLDWLRARSDLPDDCLVGEPTNPAALGEMIKIGRRGSLNGVLTVRGRQGHAAYPDLADNPIPRLVRMLLALAETPIDGGTDHFEPSRLTLTTVDVGNPATNVIPESATAGFNVRFNDSQTAASVRGWIERHCHAVGGAFDLVTESSGEAFLSPPGDLTRIVADAVTSVTGRTPVLGTSGGTSDARFIKDVCRVCEFGMVGATAHQVDEHVAVADVAGLTAIYAAVLDRYFAVGR